MNRVRIGITAPVSRDQWAYRALHFAVWLCGGQPVKITTGMSWQATKVHGLIIGGGDDIFPPFYDQKAITKAQYDKDRDEMEMYWSRKARHCDIPVLAICRGAQIMNVAAGGDLYQSLTDHFEDAEYPTSNWRRAVFRKPIHINPGSLLAKILGVTKIHVNSIHTQAIAGLGKALKITAQEPNGIVQAIEDPSKPFCLGVQFHPEFLIYRRPFRQMFTALVQAARAYENPEKNPKKNPKKNPEKN